MSDLSDKVCLVTGANTGIGAVTAKELANAGARVILACRSAERAKPVADAIGERAEIVELDLGSLASVRACAKDVLAKHPRIHVLVNNAGLAGARGQTSDGFELTFGVNHLGHFLFTELLWPALEKAAPARVVMVSSDSHYQAKGIDFAALREPTRTRTGLREYAVSKLANVLHCRELARLRPDGGVTTYSLHPGTVASDIWRGVPWPIRPMIRAFMLTEEEGAKTTLHCAMDPALANESGRYYAKCAEKRPSRLAQDDALARELWEKSVSWASL